MVYTEILNTRVTACQSGVRINHLSYADDTILFGSGDKGSIIIMMKVLRDHEKVSGQMINKSKSFSYLHDKTPLIVAIRLRILSGIRQGNFPFIYLGCPVFYGRKNDTHFGKTSSFLLEVNSFSSIMLYNQCPCTYYQL